MLSLERFFCFSIAPGPLISLTILVPQRHFTQFELKIRAIKLQKMLKFVLLENCFSDNLIKVEICY